MKRTSPYVSGKGYNLCCMFYWNTGCVRCLARYCLDCAAARVVRVNQQHGTAHVECQCGEVFESHETFLKIEGLIE